MLVAAEYMCVEFGRYRQMTYADLSGILILTILIVQIRILLTLSSALGLPSMCQLAGILGCLNTRNVLGGLASIAELDSRSIRRW